MNWDHPDLQARKLLMAAHLYYDRNTSIISDAEYDELSHEVAMNVELMEDFELLGSDGIDDLRVWQLGSPEEIRATGAHFKFTWATIHGAEAWLQSEKGVDLEPYLPKMKWSNKFGLSACGVSG